MLTKPVYYLRRQDFDIKGNLVEDYFRDKIVIIFIHTTMCVYCQMAAPEFQQAANMNTDPNFVFAAIQADGNCPGERECAELFSKMLRAQFRGFPDYAIFKNNVPTGMNVPNRSKESILKTLKHVSKTE